MRFQHDRGRIQSDKSHPLNPPESRKTSIGRYLEAVPLTADEGAIVEGDLEKLDGLIRKLDNVPTLDGRTPNEIDVRKARP